MRNKTQYEKNYKFNYNSDIFHINNINKPEIEFKKIKNVITNQTTYNFLDWNNKNKTFEEGNINIPNNENNINKISRRINLTKHNKSSIFLGNDDKSYIIKKDKCKNIYNPQKYFTNVSPYARKVFEIFGEEYNNNKENLPINKKTSFGYYENEVYKLKKKNYDNNEIINPKRKKLDFFYKDNFNEESFSDRQFKKIKRNHSTEIYDNLIDDKYNNNNNKNNITFKNKSLSEREIEIKEVKNSNNIIGTKKDKIKRDYYGKKNMINYNDSAIPVKLDWRNQKINLYFRPKSNEKILKETAKERKLNEFYGENYKLIKNNSQKDFTKNDLENLIKYEYPNENESKIKKRLENISSFEMGKIIRVNSMKNMIPKEMKSHNYEIKNGNLNNIDLKNFEKNLLNAGIHIYDIRMDEQYTNGNQKGKITFKIRENIEDKNFNETINKIKVNLKQKNNIDLNNYSPNKKVKPLSNQIPTTIRWNDTQIHNYTKNRKVETTIQGRIHNKRRANSNNKITDIIINHKYKNH